MGNLMLFLISATSNIYYSVPSCSGLNIYCPLFRPFIVLSTYDQLWQRLRLIFEVLYMLAYWKEDFKKFLPTFIFEFTPTSECIINSRTRFQILFIKSESLLSIGNFTNCNIVKIKFNTFLAVMCVGLCL